MINLVKSSDRPKLFTPEDFDKHVRLRRKVRLRTKVAEGHWEGSVYVTASGRRFDLRKD